MDDDVGLTNHDIQTVKSSKKYQFFGSYTHSIDSKGRLIVPSAYRDELGETFTIGPTLDIEGIALYPEEIYDWILEGLSALNQRNPRVQQYCNQFYKLSYRAVQPDTQGRVLLPTKLRARTLGETRDLEISGASNHVRVLGADKADGEDNSFIENKAEILEEIGHLNLNERR